MCFPGIRYTKGGEKDRVKLMRSPYADIAETILTQLRADPYSNTGGGLYAREPQGGPDGGDIRAKKVYDRKRLKRAGIKLSDDLPFRK